MFFRLTNTMLLSREGEKKREYEKESARQRERREIEMWRKKDRRVGDHGRERDG